MWSMVKSVFKRLQPELKAALPVLIVAIIVLVNVAIWWMGPWWEYQDDRPLESVSARLIASIMFTLMCFCIWGWRQWRRLKGMEAQQQKSKQLQEDPILALEERQERELDQVMKGLKDSLARSDYLYALPWYLVLGIENAGKTSLINRSGQKFVFSSVMRASGKKSDNPHSFDWWIGDDAVVIDPDGELLTQKSNGRDGQQDMERRLWLHFVQWLEKTRSRRPLNGVVLVLDLSALLVETVAERKAYAHLLRARLRELMETLSTRLPVYISLTKLDLLQGFEPFFRHMTKAQREEILGFTFSLDSVNNLDSWLNEFDQDWLAFIERINACLPKAMLNCRDKDERAQLYGFSRQLAGAHGLLREFFHDALASDSFSTSALVRGVYLTSVYQQGVPTNAYVDGAARRYGLADAINSAQRSENSTTYFTQSLFSRIIYPEAGLASDNFRVAKRKRRIMMLSVVACSIASAMLIGSWHRYYLKNSAQADAVLDKVNSFNAQIEKNSLDPAASNIIPPLNTIRAATLEFGFFREKPWLISDLGLYQGHAIGPKVEETYLNLLAYRYLPILQRQLAAELANAPKASEQKLALLRVYRMLIDKSGRRDAFVTDYFADTWQKAFPGNSELQDQLMQHLQYALQHTDLAKAQAEGNKEAIAVVQPFAWLVKQAQQELTQLPIEERVYRYLKRSSVSQLGEPLDLRLTIGPVNELVFEKRSAAEDSLQIPQMLTSNGFKTYLIPASDSVTELALIDSWVLGQSQNINFSEADKLALQNKIVAQYLADYNATWRKALNSFNVKAFDGIGDAVTVLDNIAVSHQPLKRILETLDANTELFPQLPEDEQAKAALLKSQDYRWAQVIDSNFHELNQLYGVNAAKADYFEEVMAAIVQLHDYMLDIQNSPDRGKAALEAAQKRINLSGSDPVYALQRIASGLPKPMDSMVAKLADESWKVVLKEAVRHLEIKWYDEVYSEYEQTLATRYPFDPKASKQASIADFERFFGPQGVMASFYDKQLKWFVEEHAAQLSALTNSDKGLIKPEVLSAFDDAQKIRAAYFNLKGNLDVQFSLEPLQMSPNKRRSVFNIDGQYVEYTHGPSRNIELVWPNTLRQGAESRLTLVPSEQNQSPRSLGSQGPWAFFKLLEGARITGSSSTSVDYRFAVDNGEVTYRIHTRDSINPFTTNLLSNYQLPKTLY
ncbi:type VI secretion system membrane subunit TssM [Shewanella khirikhana]|uniref:type VI secretion system membrane subunit TssM n=1 Tax=Shewanella khirikhana TaxID=1965282 RepID=UPI0030D4E676